MLKKISLLIICLLFISSHLYAGNYVNDNAVISNTHVDYRKITLDEIPEDLKDWVKWVKYNLPDNDCPYDSASELIRHCDWSSTVVDLNLFSQKANFSQKAKIFKNGWVKISGDLKFWPQEVMANGKKVGVISKDGYPQIYLSKGNYQITGKFFWDQIPDSIQIPAQTGILNLVINSQKIDFPNINKKGIVWLSKNNQAKLSTADNLDLRIYRKVTNSVPLMITTHLDIRVSGKSREILLDHALLPHFIPMSIESALPNQIEKDGKLKIQLKPGNWTLALKARQKSKNDQITLIKSKDYSLSEVWVFEEQNHLRVAEVKGLPILDPEQTTIPSTWKNFRAYQINPGEKFTIVEKYRGNINKRPDNLSLYREFWLDFNGDGYTFKDELSGKLNSSWRLNINQPFQLGKAQLNFEPQLITQSENQKPGVEIRQGNINLQAHSRLNDNTRSFPIVGWDHDVQKLSAKFHIPPGWKLFSASGVDSISGTWIKRWSLLDLFLVLFISAIFFKLWGIKWGIISLLGLALSFTERNAPQYIWLIVLTGAVLAQLNIQGKLKKLVVGYKYSALVILILITLPFMVTQVRVALFPSLDSYKNSTHFTDAIGSVFSDGNYDSVPQSPQENSLTEKNNSYYGSRNLKKMKPRTTITQGQKNDFTTSLNLLMNQAQWVPGSKVQTGPGLPNWNWQESTLTWNGPVHKDNKLCLYLISPFQNLLLTILQIVLLFLLMVRLVNLPQNMKSILFNRKSVLSIIPIFFCFGLFFLSSNQVQAVEIPSQEILNELSKRLTTHAPKCFPNCSSISKIDLKTNNDQLIMNLDVSALANTAIALPGNILEWNPDEVLLNNSSKVHLKRDHQGILWLQVKEGQNDVILKGKLPPRNQFNLSFPLKPYYVSAHLKGWSLEGIKENGQVDNSIQFSRIEKKSNLETLKSSHLSSFLQVERHLFIGLLWKMETRIIRLTPTGSPVLVEIPLLDGESPTTEGVKIKDGKALVTMSPNQIVFTWESVLKEKESIALTASNNSDWKEIWMLDASPIWRVKMNGIPSINQSGDDNYRVPTWHPWSGEKLNLNITRPIAIEGQTLTISESHMNVTPGIRNTSIHLSMKMTSSLGGKHKITLPENASLQSVMVDGKITPLSLKNHQLNIPVKPGFQNVNINWNQPEGIGLLFKNPKVDFGISHVNLKTNFNMGKDRWILFLGGPKLGPAILFWSYIFIIFIASYILSRINFVPVKFYQWFLLGLGLSQVYIADSIIIIGWFIILGYRSYQLKLSPVKFNLRQILIVIWTFAAAGAFLYSLEQGLLGYPDMQISGNNSSSLVLKWFQDRSNGLNSSPWVLSVPMYIYRIAMLLWALWLAFALIKWIKWGWNSFVKEGAWKKMQLVKKVENNN